MVRVTVHLRANPPYAGNPVHGSVADAGLMLVSRQSLINQLFGSKKRGLYIHFRRI